MHPLVDRRSFLAAGVASIAAAELSTHAAPPSAPTAAPAAPPRPPGRSRTLRFAHFTDVHVQPERAAAQGLAAALRHAQSIDDPAQFIVTGGDLVMDAFEADEARARLQWDLFTNVLRSECSLPVDHCLGNHDFWGGHKRNSRTRGDESRWGTGWAREALGLAADHHAFERGGWKFVVLDSVRADAVAGKGDGYTAHLDEAQFAWLTQQLASTPAATPVVVVSHVPLLTVTVAASDAKRSKNNAVTIPGDLMHSDTARVAALWRQHPNVKLCLSGHIHQIDRVEYRGVTYICDGAVSGAWWKGPNAGFPEGYGLVDLFDDGTFDWRYVPYGWVARA